MDSEGSDLAGRRVCDRKNRVWEKSEVDLQDGLKGSDEGGLPKRLLPKFQRERG